VGSSVLKAASTSRPEEEGRGAGSSGDLGVVDRLPKSGDVLKPSQSSALSFSAVLSLFVADGIDRG